MGFEKDARRKSRWAGLERRNNILMECVQREVLLHGHSTYDTLLILQQDIYDYQCRNAANVSRVDMLRICALVSDYAHTTPVYVIHRARVIRDFCDA